MARTILPSGEELSVSPNEILRYVSPDTLRQILRQERLRWHLKVNRDAEFYEATNSYKYSGELHNEAYYQRMELRTFPDNGAPAGYAGINNDSGFMGIPHNLDKWDESISEESKNTKVNRTYVGAFAKIRGTSRYGITDDGEVTTSTENGYAMFLCDPMDGRIYMYSNDDPIYVNNETRNPEDRIPGRAIARICDIPTRITHLKNDMDFISDPGYIHTDNNFTNSNRYIVDNLDDRTFVYPEISKDENGQYISNLRMGLNGEYGYDESDGERKKNISEDDNNDRGLNDINNYNENNNYSGISHPNGYLPGIFKSLEELKKVDLFGQKQNPKTHAGSPGAKRTDNFYMMDGIWNNSFETNDSFNSPSINPGNLESMIVGSQPIPYNGLDRSKMYQWRYNRIEVKYPTENISINIVESGIGYKVGDILRWSFGDDSYQFKVTSVGVNGQIQAGEYLPDDTNYYDRNPDTAGVGITFQNTTGSGRGAKLAIHATSSVQVYATQLKNNLYAYVDVTPTIRSDNSTPWSDTKLPDSQGGKIGVRSTAAGPAYSGINSGRGGPAPNEAQNDTTLFEHGGNPTAGVHVHLFRYVINTQNPTWIMKDGVKIYTGEWVDQGPMGVERPCDIKALLFSNPDTNNFNNYYKFSMDLLFNTLSRNPDSITTNNPNAVCVPYLHIDQIDPTPDRKFTEQKIDPNTSEIIEVDITHRVIYVNAATGMMFVYSSSNKNDPTFGYGYRTPGWVPLAGAISR